MGEIQTKKDQNWFSEGWIELKSQREPAAAQAALHKEESCQWTLQESPKEERRYKCPPETRHKETQFFFNPEKERNDIFNTHRPSIRCQMRSKAHLSNQNHACLDSADQTKLLEDNYASIHLQPPGRCSGKWTQCSIRASPLTLKVTRIAGWTPRFQSTGQCVKVPASLWDFEDLWIFASFLPLPESWDPKMTLCLSCNSTSVMDTLHWGSFIIKEVVAFLSVSSFHHIWREEIDNALSFSVHFPSQGLD